MARRGYAYALARAGIVGAAVLALSACVSGPPRRVEAPRPALPAPAATAPQHWRIDGRIAVSDGKDGGSGRIAWQQRADAYDITVRAPISNETWRLVGDRSSVRLEGGRRGAVAGDDAEALLERELGWHLPVDAVRHWVLGTARDPRVATIERDANGRARVLREAGWTVEFRAWDDGDGARAPLPKRVVARRAPYEVRLAIANWRLDAP